MTQQEKVKAIAKILKAKFTNLTVDDTIDLSYKILEAIEKSSDSLNGMGGIGDEGNNK